MARENRGERGSYRRYFPPRRKVCRFCERKMKDIDFKKADILRRYTMERGKISPRRVTGTCAFHQKKLSVAVKRARLLALLPYIAD